MREMHLKQSGITKRACRKFTENKERIKKSKKQDIPDILFKTN